MIDTDVAKGVAVESRLNDMRILGLPVQFVVVVAISLVLTIYFGAWAADARIDARAGQSVQQFDFRSSTTASSSGSELSGGLGKGDAGAGQAYGNATEGQAWEKMFLFACPLH